MHHILTRNVFITDYFALLSVKHFFLQPDSFSSHDIDNDARNKFSKFKWN